MIVGYVKDGSLKFVDVDTTTLSPLVTSGANACVVLTKRVKRNGEVKLYNKYFCSSEESAKVAFETWSSSKIFAISNAAGHLRTNETRCDPMELGVNGYTSGKHGKTALGDLATVVCSYDTTAGYSSNSLSSYFHDLGWRDRIHDLVNSDWIGLEGLSLGGNYGEATPSDLSFVLSSVNDKSCSVDKDPWPKVYSNSLSPLAAAEMARRIALYREVDPNYRFPGMTWADAQVIDICCMTMTMTHVIFRTCLSLYLYYFMCPFMSLDVLCCSSLCCMELNHRCFFQGNHGVE